MTASHLAIAQIQAPLSQDASGTSIDPVRWLAPVAMSAPGLLPHNQVHAHVLALRDPLVVNAAVKAQDELLTLIENFGCLSFISAAIARDPEDPVRAIQAATAAIRREFEVTRAEHAAHDRRVKDFNARTSPLRIEASRLHTLAVVELNGIQRRLDAPRAKAEFQRLRDAGLTDEEIAKLGRENPVAVEEQQLRRAADLRAEIAAYEKFSADPHHDSRQVEHLPALAGLVASQRAAEATPL